MKQFLIFLSIFLYSLHSSTLHLSISSNPSKLNPLIATDSASSEITSYLFNSLITFDKDAKIVTELAKSYKFLDDTTLRFVLRDDIVWSDGKKFSADDVIFTYNLIISPKVLTPYANSFKHIKSVEKVNDYEIVVKYKYPYFKALETWTMSIVPKHKLQNQKDIMTSNFNQKPIGTNSYTLDKLKASNDIKLVSNKKFFDKQPNIENIVFHFIPDPNTQFLMLKANKLDLGGLTPLQLEKQLDEQFHKNYNIYEKVANAYTYLGFNHSLQKWQNPKIKEAISLAIDRQELIDILFFGHGQVCTGPFLPKTIGFNKNIKPIKQNQQKAKQLLKDAGFDESNPFEFTLTTNINNSIRVYTAEIIQHQLSKIGVNMKIKTMEWQAFLNTVVTPRKFDTVMLGWSMGLTPDAYSIWHSDNIKLGGFNFVGYKNPKVDNLIKKAEKIVDRERFGKIYEEIFATIVNDNPYLFLYIPNSITAVNKKIKNVSNSLIGVTHNIEYWEK
jgi:peptide/nickel transport system substrate-binding protein